MASLLVLFQVADKEKRSKIAAELKTRYRVTVPLTESAYALQTDGLPVRIFDQVERFLGADDRLYVLPIRKPYTGYGPRRTTEWLSAYLPTQGEEK